MTSRDGAGEPVRSCSCFGLILADLNLLLIVPGRLRLLSFGCRLVLKLDTRLRSVPLALPVLSESGVCRRSALAEPVAHVLIGPSLL